VDILLKRWGPYYIVISTHSTHAWKRRMMFTAERVRSMAPRFKSQKLNIVVMVIGSRGDIQKILKEKYGHRVRIATHPAFQTFVEEDIGLEFLLVGGDPFRAYGVHGQESRTHSVRGDGEGW
jgi:hypothetical protein